MYTWRGQKKELELQVAEVTGSCKRPKICTGNSTWIFYTENSPNAESSLQLLARLYFIYFVFFACDCILRKEEYLCFFQHI